MMYKKVARGVRAEVPEAPSRGARALTHCGLLLGQRRRRLPNNNSQWGPNHIAFLCMLGRLNASSLGGVPTNWGFR